MENANGTATEAWNIYKKLQRARRLLSDLGLKPTGKNTYVGYSYWELGDFMPATEIIFDDLGLIGIVDTTSDPALGKLTIKNTDDPAGEVIVFSMKAGKCEIKGAQEIQMIAGEKSYLRRYLWVDALELTVNDIVDSSDRVNPEQQRNTGKSGHNSSNKAGNKGDDTAGGKTGNGGQNDDKAGNTKPVWISADQYEKAKKCSTAEELLKMINRFEADKLKMADGQKAKLREIYKTLLEAEKVKKTTVTDEELEQMRKEAEIEDKHPNEQPEAEKDPVDELDEIFNSKKKAESTIEDELKNLNKLL